MKCEEEDRIGTRLALGIRCCSRWAIILLLLCHRSLCRSRQATVILIFRRTYIYGSRSCLLFLRRAGPLTNLISAVPSTSLFAGFDIR